MAARVLLDVILSVDETLRDLGTFDLFASQIFSVGGRHSAAVTILLHHSCKSQSRTVNITVNPHGFCTEDEHTR